MAVLFKSRIPKIMVDLATEVDIAVEAAANLIAARAKDRVPVDTGTLKGSIHIERAGVAEFEVRGGGKGAWYGHLVEHGTAHTPPRPFLVPAAEESRAEAIALVDAAVDRAT